MKKNNLYNNNEIILTLISGQGGNGCVSFYKNRYIRKGKPDGGKGGDGGDIYIIKDQTINNLNHIKPLKIIKAENGFNGKKNNCSGKKGKDYILKIPFNTQIKILKQNNTFCKNKNKKYFFIIKGGKGGFGNNRFKSSTNRSPKQYQKGQKGTKIKLKIIYDNKIDISIIGLPNCGKSSITKNISNIKPKIAHYPFTTLTPQVGLLKINKDKKIFLVDTPSIYQKTCKKYINLHFLKYLKDCKIILHIIEIKKNKKDILQNMNVVFKKLLYHEKLFKKQWFIFNKADLFSSKTTKNNITYILKKIKKNNKYFVLSILKKKKITKLIKEIYKSLKN